MNFVLVKIAEQCFRCGPYAHSLLKRLQAPLSYPCYFGRKPLHMVFFLLKQTFRNEHGKINVLNSRCLEPLIHLLLNKLPYGITRGFEHHASLNAGVIDQVSFFDNIRVPLCKIHFHGSDLLNHLFVLHITYSSIENQINSYILRFFALLFHMFYSFCSALSLK